MKSLILAAMLLAATVMGACNKVTYVNPGTTPSGVAQGEKGWFFVFGLIGTKEIRADAMCPEGVHRVQSKFGFVDILVSMITLQLVSPRSYEVECAAGAKVGKL